MAQRRVVMGMQEEIGQFLERATRTGMSGGHGAGRGRAAMKRRRTGNASSSVDASSEQSRHFSPHSQCSSRCRHTHSQLHSLYTSQPQLHDIFTSQPQLRTYTTKVRTKSSTSKSTKSKAKALASASVLPPDLTLLSPSEQDELFDLVSSSPVPSSSSSKFPVRGAPAPGTAEEHKEDILRAELEGEYEAALRYYSGSEYDFTSYPPFSSPGAGPSRLSSLSYTSNSPTWTQRPKFPSSKLQSTPSPTYTLRKRHPRTKFLPGPPDNSRQTLWDWRLWFSQRKGGVARGLSGPTPPKTAETQDEDVVVELQPNGKTKRKKVGVTKERQMSVRRRKHEVVPLEEGEPWYEEVEEYKKQCVASLSSYVSFVYLTYTKQLPTSHRSRTTRRRSHPQRTPLNLATQTAQRGRVLPHRYGRVLAD